MTQTLDFNTLTRFVIEFFSYVIGAKTLSTMTFSTMTLGITIKTSALSTMTLNTMMPSVAYADCCTLYGSAKGCYADCYGTI